MTDKQTPPDWVLIEAGKRFGWVHTTYDVLLKYYMTESYIGFHVLCDMIEKHEQPPVDRKLACGDKAWQQWRKNELESAQCIGVRAIELWEQGFGK